MKATMSEKPRQERLGRPIAEGLRRIAENPQPPGDAYLTLMEWARETGHFGFDNLSHDWIPSFDDAYYVSTTITSGGFARDKSMPFGDAIAQNTAIADALTSVLMSESDIRPDKIVLASDLPKVKDWKQSDYMIFWLCMLEGVPGELAVPFGNSLQAFSSQTSIDDGAASYDDKWLGYKALVDRFVDMRQQHLLRGRNDYAQQHASIRKMIQLLDTDQSLGCRAEEHYARRSDVEMYKLVIEHEKLGDELRRQLGVLASQGAVIGAPTKAIRLVPAWSKES